MLRGHLHALWHGAENGPVLFSSLSLSLVTLFFLHSQRKLNFFLLFIYCIDFSTIFCSDKMPPTKKPWSKHRFIAQPERQEEGGERVETERAVHSQTHKINADQCFISPRCCSSRPAPAGKNTSQSPLLQEGVKSLWCFTQSSITYATLNQE